MLRAMAATMRPSRAVDDLALLRRHRRRPRIGPPTSRSRAGTLLVIHNQRDTFDVGRPVTAWCFAIAVQARRSAAPAPRRETLTDLLTTSVN
jgi:hypothetical protein